MIKSVVFDLDGMLYCGNKAVEGAVDAVAALINMGYLIFFLTNNSGKTQEQIVQKLNELGFCWAHRYNTYCSSYAIRCYLQEKKIGPIYLIGTDGLKRDLTFYNIRVEDSSDVSAVVVGIDLNFSYQKIATALQAINKGAKLIVANLDPSYPIEDNRRMPGCGAMVGAITGATGYVPDFIVGKPNTYMLELLCAEHRFSSEEICIIGDEPRSDIQMAKNFGCHSILFDPEDAFPEFSGRKIKRLVDIVSSLIAL